MRNDIINIPISNVKSSHQFQLVVNLLNKGSSNPVDADFTVSSRHVQDMSVQIEKSKSMHRNGRNVQAIALG